MEYAGSIPVEGTTLNKMVYTMEKSNIDVMFEASAQLGLACKEIYEYDDWFIKEHIYIFINNNYKYKIITIPKNGVTVTIEFMINLFETQDFLTKDKMKKIIASVKAKRIQ